MENNNTPEFYADRINKILAPLDDKRQEMHACLKEIRRMFSALKGKIKKYEKIIAAMDETNDKLGIMVASSNAQLAMNKFEGIQKRIKLCSQYQNDFEKHYKQLPIYSKQSDSELAYWVNRTAHFNYEFKSALSQGEDMLRIANKHLKKSDDFFAHRRRLWKGYPMRPI